LSWPGTQIYQRADEVKIRPNLPSWQPAVFFGIHIYLRLVPQVPEHRRLQQEAKAAQSDAAD
jgi:hypothetical protein